MNRITFIILSLTAACCLKCGETARELEVEIKTDRVEIVAESKEHKTCAQKMVLKMETKDDGVEFRLDFKAKTVDAKSKFHVRQKVFRVIEFEDTNNNSLIDNNETIQVLQVGGKNKWSDIQSKLTPDGVYTMNATSTWFTVVARYAGDPVSFTVNSTGYELKPNAIKIDYIINNFPYKGENTKLAIDGRFKSKAKFHNRESKDNDDDFEIMDEGATEGAKFTWIKTVSADGVEVPVVASPLQKDLGDDETDKPVEGESNYKLIWVFNTTARVKHFVWDPELAGVDVDESETSGETSGASATSATSGQSGQSAGAAAASSILCVAALFWVNVAL